MEFLVCSPENGFNIDVVRKIPEGKLKNWFGPEAVEGLSALSNRI